MSNDYSQTDSVAQNYYNDDSADRFYDTIWGGEDIHIGLYQKEEDSIAEASRRTVDRMASLVPDLGKETRVLDIGAGYGGSARFLAQRYGCPVACVNISEVQNQKNRQLNQQAGLESLIEVIDGTFENLPFPDNSFEVVWSQDSILHSGNREKVFDEVNRVLKPGGYFIFSDPMQSDDCPQEELQPVLNRIQLSSMGSPGFYRSLAQKLGWQEVTWEDLSHQLVNHYGRVRQEVIRREEDVLKVCKKDYIDRMKVGLQHWVDTGKKGHLKWGFFVFHKKA